MSDHDSRQASDRLSEAFSYAEGLHRKQVRKGTEIPYLSHLMAVASLVQENGGDEDQVIAALLHDGPEDQGGETTLTEIRQRFGDRVATIVEECSDTFEAPKPAWQERKRRYLKHLESVSAETLLVSAADKVHNLSCITRDFREQGDTLWDRFNAGRDRVVWYYRELLRVYENRQQPQLERLIGEMRRLLAELTTLIGEARSTAKPPETPSSMPYTVLVDDNYHYQDESERYKLGSFETAEDAIQACRQHVDECLAEFYEPGFTAGELFGKYMMFGEDPFVISETTEPVEFSAWDYAREKSKEICKGKPP